jgi:hypothetical protein
MKNDAGDERPGTLDVQAERIVRLERELAARDEALEVTAAECARLRTLMRQHAGAAVAPAGAAAPSLSTRERMRKAVILTAGRVLPRGAKRFVKRFWDPWARR